MSEFVRRALSEFHPVKKRLLHVYEFAQEIGAIGNHHLDIGTYDGFGVKSLLSTAQTVTTIDNDPVNLWRASTLLQEYIQANQVHLLEMDARHLNVEQGLFDSATIIEVFGAGFEGTEKDIQMVFEKVHKALKPGGTLVFTIKSKTGENLLKPLGFEQTKGFSIDREETLIPIVNGLFENVTWYGQLITIEHSEGIQIPLKFNPETGEAEWHPNSYIPRNEDVLLGNEIPLFWICVCQKP